MAVLEIDIQIDPSGELKIRKLSQATKDLETSASKSAASATSAFKSFGIGATVALATAGLLVKKATELADEYKLMEGRLKLVTKSSQELATVQTELFSISQNTRQSLKATTDLYTSLARSTQSLGKSQKDVLAITETINKAIIVSGASASSAQAALVQLGQGFASGTLRGDELNSVLEQTPRIAEAIAKGMGITVGQLRSLGAEGKLTGEAVFEALKSQAKAVDEEFSKMPKTVDQASEQMGNSLTKLVGYLDKTTGASNALSGAISGISKAADDFTRSLELDDLPVDSIEILQEKLIRLGAEWSDLERRKTLSLFSWDWLPEDAIIKKQKEIEGLISLLVTGKEGLYNKLSEESEDLSDRFSYTIPPEKQKAIDERLYDIHKDKEDKKIALVKQKALEAEKAYKEISEAIAKTSMDDYDYGVYLINQKVEEYRKAGVKEIEISQYVTNAKMELGIKQLQEETKEYEKAKQEKKQAIEHELKMLEEQYRIQARQVNLLDDEVDRAIALAKIEHDRSVQSLRLQMDKEPELKALYEIELDYEDKLLAKTLENYTLHGQVINGIKDDLESGFGEFFDYQSDNFMKFGDLATNILHEVYMEIVRINMIKPLASGLTSGLMSFVPSLFGGSSYTPYTDGWASAVANAQGGVYDSPSLSSYSNQVVSSPTLFAFASGGVPNMGVFGEAGSEAIMPLTRTSSGDLGVKATASNMRIEIKNESPQSLEVTSARQTFDSEGAVLSIVINGIQKNKMGLRDMIGSR